MSTQALSSRERLLATIRYQATDHVPLLFHSFGFVPPPHLHWSNRIEEAQRWLSLGLDALLWDGMPLRFHPSVQVRRWEEAPVGEACPVMIAEYETPAGVFRQQVARTADWVSPDWPMHLEGAPRVDLFDDYNVPRYRNNPITTEADLEKLRYLLYPLSEKIATDARAEITETARQAHQLGVLLVGHASCGTDAAVWLCGVTPLLEMAIDRPDLFRALLDIIHAWDMRNLENLLETPVDLVMRRGYYEGTSFWSPAIFREFFQPHLAALTATAHQAGRAMGYTMSMGVMPLLDELAQVGYDMHYLLDPLPNSTRIDLAAVKTAWQGKTAVFGGLNSPVTLECGTPEDIRREVRDAVQLLGQGGGLALSPAEGIFASTPWASIEAVIEAWKEVREY